jgi:hypothetical protein
MILASLAVLLSLGSTRRAFLLYIPLLAGIVFFRPTFLTLTQGQVSGLILFILAGIVFLWQKEKWFLGGLLLGILVLKPNLGVPILLLLAFWLLRRNHLHAILGAFISGVFLLVLGLIYNPGWVTQYWQVGANKLAVTFGGSPTLWGLSYLGCQYNTTCTLAFGGVASLILVSGFLWLMLARRTDITPLTLISLSATVTLLVTPYTWTYDQILLLLPIVDLTLKMKEDGIRYILVSTWPLGLDFLILLILVLDTLLKVEIFNAIVPLLILVLHGSLQTRRRLKTAPRLVE